MNTHAVPSTENSSPAIGDPTPAATPEQIQPEPENTEVIIDGASTIAKSDAPTVVLPVDGKKAANDSPHANKGRGEEVTQPMRKAVVVDIKEDIKSKWKQHIGAAKAVWGKLSNEELLKTEGNEHKLATLVQDRHEIARSDAYRQVNEFFAKQKSSG